MKRSRWQAARAALGQALRSRASRTTIGEAFSSPDPGEQHDPLLVDSLADGVFVAQDYRFVYANLALPKMLGYAKDDFVGAPFEQIVAPNTLPIWNERFAQRVSTQQEPVRSYEVRLMKKDRSTEIELELVATRTLYRGRPAVLGLLRDITERKKVADELASHRERLEALIEQRTQALQTETAARADTQSFAQTIIDLIPGRIAYYDRDLRCRFVNKGYCQWTGQSQDQVIGKTVKEAVGAPVFADREPYLRAALNGRAQHFERQETNARGEPVTTLIHYTPDIRDDGWVLGCFVLALDVTQSKQAEKVLQRLNAELVQARDKAQAAAVAKDAFLANMSHEILTPMNAIVGLTHLLQRNPNSPASPDRLAGVCDAADQLMGFIGVVLDLQKIESGELVLDNELIDLEALMNGAMERVAEQATHKGLSLSVDSTDLPHSVRGDATRLSQALVNLLANAVKFTLRGSVSLTGRVERARGSALHLRFEVCDTGIGIEPGRIEHLFAAFEQHDGSSTRRFGGSGLGLTITRQLARLMGGEAGAVSELGVGSRFWIDVVVQPAEPGAAPLPGSAREQDLRDRHAGEWVLLAEDNLVNQDVAVALLTMAGLQVDVAQTGAQAVTMATTKPYRAILMDVQMPELDGLEATRQLRARPATANVPIIAMTTSTLANDRAACLEAGMNDHLAKPVEPSALYEALRRWMSIDDAPSAPAPLALKPSVTLDDIAGLNASRGLAFFAGNEPVFHGALKQFAGLYGEGIGPAGSPFLAVQPGRWSVRQIEGLRSELHSIGGACATIGAQAASEQAQRIGELLRRAPQTASEAESAALFGEVGPALSVLSADLVALARQIRERLGDSADAVPPSA